MEAVKQWRLPVMMQVVTEAAKQLIPMQQTAAGLASQPAQQNSPGLA